jgi:hypothetical protein
MNFGMSFNPPSPATKGKPLLSYQREGRLRVDREYIIAVFSDEMTTSKNVAFFLIAFLWQQRFKDDFTGTEKCKKILAKYWLSLFFISVARLYKATLI